MGGVRTPYALSDALWEQIEPLIPKRENTHPFGGGRPRRPDRQCMEAILFVLSTGCQWKALDATGLCPGSTTHDRFQEWAKAGGSTHLGSGPDASRAGGKNPSPSLTGQRRGVESSNGPIPGSIATGACSCAGRKRRPKTRRCSILPQASSRFNKQDYSDRL